MNFLETFSAQLKLSMKASGFSQIALAAATGIKQSAISTYCKGNGLPNAESLYLLARALGVSMEKLLTGEDGIQTSDSAGCLSELTAMKEKLQAMKKVLPLISEANTILSKNFLP